MKSPQENIELINRLLKKEKEELDYHKNCKNEVAVKSSNGIIELLEKRKKHFENIKTETVNETN